MNDKLQTHYHRIHSKPEENSGEQLVETAGYVDRKTRIENMIRAGERLVAIRKGYDTNDPNDDDVPVDPTRSPSFDMADASDGLLLAQGTLQKLKKKFKGSETAQDASESKESDKVGKDAQKVEEKPV